MTKNEKRLKDFDKLRKCFYAVDEDIDLDIIMEEMKKDLKKKVVREKLEKL